MKSIRMLEWVIITVLLTCIIAYLAPQLLPVTVYKLSLVTLAGVIGYRIDRAVFPYARPHEIWEEIKEASPCADVKFLSMIYSATMIRRSIIMLGVMVGTTLGL